MTTVIQTALPRADYFSSSPIDPSAYPALSYPDSLLPKSPYSHHSYGRQYAASAPSSTPSSPSLTYSSFSRGPSYASTPASVVSISNRPQFDYATADDDMNFPDFDPTPAVQKDPYAPPKEASDDSLTRLAPTLLHDPLDPAKELDLSKDDQAVNPEPTRHVDYLSHDWREEDIWASWSYIVHRRKEINNSTRLENASWRTWVKTKHGLKTVSPESLNWLKDCDTTWLYGPLQTAGRRSLLNTTPPPSRLSHSSSFINKKPILKKKSASALMLERSLSQRTLLARASEILRSQQSSPAHQGNPVYRRHISDFSISGYSGSSVLNTPALEDSVPGFSRTRSSFGFTEPPTPISSSRNSFSSENKTIMPLPPTTLKRQSDPPELEVPEFWSQVKMISPSPSQETLRPTRPSHNFLLDDDPEVDDDEPWHPRSYGDNSQPSWQEEYEPGPNMRRTESGMFMPYDEEAEDEAAMNDHLFGRAMYAVNTIRDIAHVVWNVGWHRDKDRAQNDSRRNR
ncbi:hypothetical protein DV735_g950, partial [Chaetothyriales sp. CBS 134920]